MISIWSKIDTYKFIYNLKIAQFVVRNYNTHITTFVRFFHTIYMSLLIKLLWIFSNFVLVWIDKEQKWTSHHLSSLDWNNFEIMNFINNYIEKSLIILKRNIIQCNLFFFL